MGGEITAFPIILRPHILPTFPTPPIHLPMIVKTNDKTGAVKIMNLLYAPKLLPKDRRRVRDDERDIKFKILLS